MPRRVIIYSPPMGLECPTIRKPLMKSRCLSHRAAQTGHLLLTCGLLLWGAFAAAGPVASLSDEQRREQQEFHILAAELAGQRGQLRFAAEHYLKALELVPGEELAERATRVALYAEADDLALRAAQIWIALNPEHLEARLLITRLGLRSGDLDLAYLQSAILIEEHPQGVAAAFRELARNLAGEVEDSRAAMDLLKMLVDDYPQEAAGHYALGLLSLRQEDAVAAERAADVALELEPGWSDALLLKLTALLRQKRLAEAEVLVARQEGDDEWMAGLHLAYARLLLEAEQGEVAIRQFKQTLEYDSENPEALYALALLYLNEEDHEAAYSYLEDLYDLETPRQDEVAYYLGGIEETRGDFEEALEWYERVGDSSHAMEARQRQAYALFRLKRTDEARELIANLRSVHQEDAQRLYLVEGELLFQARQYQQAAELYNQALAEYPDDPDLLYGRSLVSERLGRFTLAERDLRRLLEMDPEDPRSLNALGYILSNHTKRYQEALDLVSRALALTPDDATVIDSMGWIKYRMGELNEALRFLSQAFQLMPDPEVAAHLGEVLWQLGQRDRAQNIWREALREDPDHPVLQETINRLTR